MIQSLFFVLLLAPLVEMNCDFCKERYMEVKSCFEKANVTLGKLIKEEYEYLLSAQAELLQCRKEELEFIENCTDVLGNETMNAYEKEIYSRKNKHQLTVSKAIRCFMSLHGCDETKVKVQDIEIGETNRIKEAKRKINNKKPRKG